ncbi:hypothetical protein CIHG_02529 [Coccidioides immitis H538.4]|uniref:Rhodopsin domain-containing protein n=3 Tax=Coccidioides immitis TaxID=5501 RepID=A0A0J8R270_COCIT|nr:hypothetical protein CIRG_02862 [Coccidioides immitis RMSCC 2394]KMU79244.1 hypothetical protein CISG_07675 [Coccidioides immitis RMSCC 3703]KMU84745.1 hypothetical protein CIHG_02529 [Coccidioides immitis H538.4]TPX23544.1 hypothetical protein DIZ76_012878 [Coccidioides immitis]
MSSMALLGDFSLLLHRRNEPEFDPSLSDTSKAPMILSISGFFSGVALLVVLVRLYVRIFVVKRFSLDDFFITLASVCASLIIGYLIFESKHGLGRYTQFLTRSDLSALVKLAYFHFMILGLGIYSVKISFGLFLLRVLGRGKRRVFVKCILAALFVLLLAHLGLQIFRCIPVSAGWSLTERDTAQCLSRAGFMVFNMIICGIDAAIDGCFVTFCVVLFHNLQNTRRFRLAFIVMVAFGYLTCFAAIIKTSMSVYALKVKVKYRGDDYGLWSLLELHLALISTSLPTLGPMFKRFFSSQAESAHQLTTGRYTRRRPERLNLSRLSSAKSFPQGTPRPSTIHSESNDFEKNPGNRPGICNYKVEVTGPAMPKKIRTSSFGGYRPSINNINENCETGEIISCPPSAFTAKFRSSREESEACPSSPTSGIVRRTDVYVCMDDAVDETCEIEGEGTGPRGSKWKLRMLKQ